MKSFDVNLQNKRLSINGIFEGTGTNSSTTLPSDKLERHVKGGLNNGSSAHTALTWFGNMDWTRSKSSDRPDVFDMPHRPDRPIKPDRSQRETNKLQEIYIDNMNLSVSKEPMQSSAWKYGLSCFNVSNLTLHVAVYTLFLVLIYGKQEHSLVFGGVVHIAIVVFAPMQVAFVSSPKQQGFCLLFHLCGLYALFMDGVDAKLTGNSVYFFYIILLLSQIVSHAHKNGCRIELKIIYYSIHILAVFSIIGLRVLRREYEEKKDKEPAADPIHSFHNYAFLFDVTAFVTTAIMVSCERLF